jgi:regulator of protease activity HflC (stomatin/prohibitin superfamily)
MGPALLFVIFLLAIALVAFLAWRGLKIVQQSETMVVERLGRYQRTLDSGINIVWPGIEKVREVDWRTVQDGPDGKPIVRRQRIERIDLRETVYDFPRQSVITKDNVVTDLNALLYFQIVNPVKAVYEIANLPDAIEKLTQTTLRNVIGEMDLDETLSSRETINSKLRAILDEAADKWGVKVNRVELQDINPPADIRDAMEKQMRAERDRRAAILGAEGAKRASILEAEGIREAAILSAEGERQARILMAEAEATARRSAAEAEAEAITRISNAIGGNAVNYLVALRYIEALKDVATGGNKVVYLPYEATGVLGSLGGIRELLADGVGSKDLLPRG